ncbi:KH domain-containing protein [Candidatus Azambacteria bacterium]|nr:KH domain-containing protein [Candidatus Azambacteria bacterium]
MELTKLLEVIVQALVDRPDQVKINVVTGEQTAILELRVAQEDLGKVVGKKGAIIDAIRVILEAATAALAKREGRQLRLLFSLLETSRS